MNPFKTISGLSFAVALTLASQSEAVEFGGATVQVNYGTNYYDGIFGYSQTLVEGSVVVDFGSGFSVQGDFGGWQYSYDAVSFENLTYGGHLIYTLSPTVTLGGFYTYDAWDSGPWQVYGIEALFNPAWMDGAFQFEASIAGYQRVGDLDAATFMSVDAIYALTGNIDLTGGIMVGYWNEFGNPDDLYGNLSIGAVYNFASGMFVAADINKRLYDGSADDGWAIVNVSVGFNFGGGATFSQRSYPTYYPGD